MFFKSLNYIKKHKSLLYLIIPAFILQMLIMMPSGTNFCIEDRCGIHFWGIHSHDAMWHLEIASVAFKSFPFQVPTYAGETLSGYNILMAYFLYLLSLIGIPPIFTLFKIIPPVWFILYTFIGIQFARTIKDKPLFVFIFLGAIYFADHFGYTLYLYHHGSLFVGDQSFSLQSLTSLLNTQFALSLPLLMWQFLILKDGKFSINNSIKMSVLLFLILGLKFYGGVASALICFFYLLEGLLKKNSYKLIFFHSLIVGLFAIASTILFYNPFEAGKSGSVFSLSPFATVHSVIEAPNMVYLPDMVNARYFLYETGWSPRLIFIELFSTFLYVFFNFGSRIFGLIYIFTKLFRKKVSRIEAYILITVLATLLLNIMLIQRGDWWNTVQFGYYAIFLSNVFLAILIYDLIIHKKIWAILIAVILIILSLLNNLRIIKIFATPETGYVSSLEIEALNYLKKMPDGVIFTSFKIPKNHNFHDYRNTGYASVFTGKKLYLGHYAPLNIIGVNFKDREKKVLNEDCGVLNEIDYIYFVKTFNPGLLNKCAHEVNNSWSNIFENEEVLIYQKIIK
jgi:hypothetical protein